MFFLSIALIKVKKTSDPNLYLDCGSLIAISEDAFPNGQGDGG